MTVKEYNEWYDKQYRKAQSFVLCMDHALEKSDDNARKQMACIGWDETTKETLSEAITVLKALKQKEILKEEL